jgi:hypothetical protein
MSGPGARARNKFLPQQPSAGQQGAPYYNFPSATGSSPSLPPPLPSATIGQQYATSSNAAPIGDHAGKFEPARHQTNTDPENFFGILDEPKLPWLKAFFQSLIAVALFGWIYGAALITTQPAGANVAYIYSAIPAALVFTGVLNMCASHGASEPLAITTPQEAILYTIYRVIPVGRAIWHVLGMIAGGFIAPAMLLPFFTKAQIASYAAVVVDPLARGNVQSTDAFGIETLFSFFMLYLGYSFYIEGKSRMGSSLVLGLLLGAFKLAFYPISTVSGNFFLALGIDAVAKDTFNPFVSQSWWIYGVSAVVSLVGAIFIVYISTKMKMISKEEEAGYTKVSNE